MEFESVSQAAEQLKSLERTLSAYNHALGLLSLDASATAPSESWEGRGMTMGVLSEALYNATANPETGKLLAYLKAHEGELDPQTRREAQVLGKNYDQLFRIPGEEYVAYTVLLNDAQTVWEKAKAANDFAMFLPYLEKIVAANRKFAGYYNPDIAPYDALLNEYEEGMTMEVLDEFFARLRGAIVPLLEKVQKRQYPLSPLAENRYPVAAQREYAEFLMDVLGLDRRYCAISESEHPFTTNFNNRDVRITTHYHENNLTPSMYSVIHEGGHALYELGCDSCYNYTVLGGGVSMGIHESQSRFYENIIGRSEPFVRFVYPRVCQLFPEQTAQVTAEDFYRDVNRVQADLIRIEADELSYCLHIMVRYEIEKQLIAGTLEAKDVPTVWNRLYKEYLGVEVPNDAMGCLQDVHWAGGMIGYFPSYALGSAYGAQMLRRMEADVDGLWENVAKGDLTGVTGWLKEHIHRHAGFHKPVELFEMACGKFDPQYYIDYLTQKFTKIYNL